MENQRTSECLLSDRELDVLRRVATGATNQQIALELVISVNTVKVHLRNIFAKLGVESRTEASLLAIREGWIALDVPTSDGTEGTTDEPITPSLPRLRIAPWQRAFFLVASLVVLIGVVLPPRRALTADNQFSDHPNGAPGYVAPTGTTRWSAQAQMPTARSRLAVVSYENKVYAIAGDTAEGVSGAVEVYDPATGTWSRRTDKPQPVRNVSAVVLNDRIYVPGGYDANDEAVSTLAVYDPANDTWSQAAPVPTPLFAYAAAALDGRLYLFGGSDGTRYLDSVLIYDPETDAWSTGTPMSQAVGFAAAATMQGRIYVAGGYDGQNEMAQCVSYDPAQEESATGPWKTHAPLHSARGGLAMVAAEGYLYAIGGGWTQYLTTSERYDVAKDEWVPFDSPLVGQWRTLGAATAADGDGSVIHAIGGWSDRHLSAHHAYKTFFRIYLPGL